MSATDDRVTMDQMAEFICQESAGQGLARRITRARFQAFLDDPLRVTEHFRMRLTYNYSRNAAICLRSTFHHFVNITPGGFNLEIDHFGCCEDVSNVEVIVEAKLVSFDIDLSSEEMFYWLSDDKHLNWTGPNLFEFITFFYAYSGLVKGTKMAMSIASLWGIAGKIIPDPDSYLMTIPNRIGKPQMRTVSRGSGFPKGTGIVLINRGRSD